MTNKELLKYCIETFNCGSSFTGNEIVIKLKLTNIVHTQLKTLVNNNKIGRYAKKNKFIIL